MNEVRIDRKKWKRLVQLSGYNPKFYAEDMIKLINEIQKEMEDDEYIMQPEDELIVNPKTHRLQIKKKEK